MQLAIKYSDKVVRLRVGLLGWIKRWPDRLLVYYYNCELLPKLSEITLVSSLKHEDINL